MSSRLIFFLVALVVSHQAWAQQCDTSRPMSTPADNFVIDNNGTLTELSSGLTWQRCAVGQQWDGSDCRGEAKQFDWHQAKEYAAMVSMQSESRWRVPTLTELATIVERQCERPRINSELFPSTVPAPHWSSTTRRSNDSEAYAVDFADKGVLKRPQQMHLFLRLVSGRD